MKKLRIRIAGLFLLIYIFPGFSFAQFTKLYDFAGAADGQYPRGDLFSDGTFLYGMTDRGGINSLGVIFKIKPDGTGYTKLLDFAGASNGERPNGSLISDGTFLYGMIQNGGVNDMGIIFKIRPDGTDFAKILDFSGTDGSWPDGSLIYDGVFLYGMATGGGANGMGAIFKIKPDGTGYSKLLDFAGSVNGKNPYGSLISDGTFLYGMTMSGGADNSGLIFKIKPDGTEYTDILDFAAGPPDGGGPNGTLISDSTFLYGMTTSGGVNGWGNIFKINKDGTGYVNMFDFDDTNGGSPQGSLIIDGSELYGMTMRGAANHGVAFKINKDGTGFTNLFNFAGVSTGSEPYGSLISDGTFIYGMACYGGINNKGTIFKYQYAEQHHNIIAGITGYAQTEGLSVFPNPSNGDFTISLKREEIFILVSQLGQTLQTIQLDRNNNNSASVTGLQPGIYFLLSKSDPLLHYKVVVAE